MLVKNKEWKNWDANTTLNLIPKEHQENSALFNNCESIGEIKSLISATNKILSQYANEEMSLSDMSPTDYAAALSLLTRTIWKYKSTPSIVHRESVNMFNKDVAFDVNIERSPNFILKITTPLLYPNAYAGAYLTAANIERSIMQNIEKLGPISTPKSEKIIMIFDRYVESAIRDICDNDNYEQRRVTNAIANVLGFSDAYDTMFFYYQAHRCEKGEGKSIIIVCTESQFIDNIKHI